jgi:hypothetical protein
VSESLFFNAIGGIMVSVLALSGRSMSLSPGEFKLKTIELGICYSSAKQRIKNYEKRSD